MARTQTLKGIAPGTKFQECADGPQMIVIPPGNFIMGSPPTEEGRFENEGPQHQVTIARAFALGVTHVTRGEYATFVRETGRPSGDGCYYWDGKQALHDPARNWRDPGFTQTDREPVVCISWEDAQAYVQWLNQRVKGLQQATLPTATGPYRLPTEAEWEYAARAGTTTRYFWGNDESALCRNANGRDLALKRVKGWDDCADCDDGYVYTSPVGSFPPNGFGLHDMAGNAWQWTEDCYHDTYAGAPCDGTAWISEDCENRVFRGGAWSFGPRGLRSAYRDKTTTNFRYNGFGFRIARRLD